MATKKTLDIKLTHTWNPTKKLPDPAKDKIGVDNRARWVTERNFEHRKAEGYEPVEAQDGVVTNAYKNRLMRISKEKFEERKAQKLEKLIAMERRLKEQRSKGVRGKQVITRDGKTILRSED